jgi:hypothetical protein
MGQMKNRSWIAAAAVAGAFALLAGCSQMKQMMGEEKGENRGRAQNVVLSGNNQVPPVTTPATGSGTVSINADRSVTARITVSGMTPTAAYKAGNTYVNVHSARNPGGEVRAQLRAIDR